MIVRWSGFVDDSTSVASFDVQFTKCGTSTDLGSQLGLPPSSSLVSMEPLVPLMTGDHVCATVRTYTVLWHIQRDAQIASSLHDQALCVCPLCR
jgi:hypothetical protein